MDKNEVKADKWLKQALEEMRKWKPNQDAIRLNSEIVAIRRAEGWKFYKSEFMSATNKILDAMVEPFGKALVERDAELKDGGK